MLSSSRDRHRVGGSATPSIVGQSIYASSLFSMEMGEDSATDSNVLNDQQWVLQVLIKAAYFRASKKIFLIKRKKIGLSRKTNRSIEKVKKSHKREADSIAFIRKNFSRRECLRFVADPKKNKRPLGARPGPEGNGPCHCGAPVDEHRSRQ